MSLTGPIDQTHADCLAARSVIRAAFNALRVEASVWEPAPFDAAYGSDIVRIPLAELRPGDTWVVPGDDAVLIERVTRRYIELQGWMVRFGGRTLGVPGSSLRPEHDWEFPIHQLVEVRRG